MKRVRLFLLMTVAGAAGGALGSVIGAELGRGGFFIGGAVLGAALVVATGRFAASRQWVTMRQRPWVIAGGLFGFALAGLAALSTLGSPTGPLLSMLLIGSGAVLGTVMGTTRRAAAAAKTQS